VSRFDEHKARLRAFAEPGGPLSRESRYATTRNPRWFGPRKGERLNPTGERQLLHDRLLSDLAATGTRGATRSCSPVLPGRGNRRRRRP
jgi:hypothetical protein